MRYAPGMVKVNVWYTGYIICLLPLAKWKYLCRNQQEDMLELSQRYDFCLKMLHSILRNFFSVLVIIDPCSECCNRLPYGFPELLYVINEFQVIEIDIFAFLWNARIMFRPDL